MQIVDIKLKISRSEPVTVIGNDRFAGPSGFHFHNSMKDILYFSAVKWKNIVLSLQDPSLDSCVQI